MFLKAPQVRKRAFRVGITFVEENCRGLRSRIVSKRERRLRALSIRRHHCLERKMSAAGHPAESCFGSGGRIHARCRPKVRQQSRSDRLKKPTRLVRHSMYIFFSEAPKMVDVFALVERPNDPHTREQKAYIPASRATKGSGLHALIEWLCRRLSRTDFGTRDCARWSRRLERAGTR